MTYRRRALASAFLLLWAVPARAQAPQPLPGDAAIERFLRQETEKISGRVLDGARTLEEWRARQERLRREYFDMLGLWPLPERTPLHATVTGMVERPGVVIEKLHYQSRPGLYVTANLYRPQKSSGRPPAVLSLCGPSGRGRDGNNTAFQDHGMWFASNGYVCLVLDTLQLGEVAGKHHGTYNLGRWWWHPAGYTPAGVECWNGVRGLDYLVSRPDVDPDRLAVTGISGGGAGTIWVAAADERVKCAVPVSGMSDLESYVSHKVINGHCDCMFLYNTYRWEWTTILARIAPRPLLFANSDNDSIFPMDGNRRVIERLRKIYELYGHPEWVAEHVSKGGHDYRPDLRLAIFRWINKHLKNDTGSVQDADFPPLPGAQLRVFPEDKDIPADALNARIDESFVPRAEVKAPPKDGFAAWQKQRMKDLRQRCFRDWPERVPAAEEAKADAAVAMTLVTEPGIEVSVTPHLPKENADGAGGLVVVLNEDEDPAKGIPEWAGRLVRGRAVYLLAPRGVGPGRWTRQSPPNYVERAHVLLGRTVDQGRVRDVAATVRLLDGKAGGARAWAVAGRGPAGVIAAYAALLEPVIAEVVCVEPPASHRAGPYLLGVQRVLDIPDALGLLAPRRLVLVKAKDSGFERTAAIFQAAEASDRLRREE